MQKSPSLRNTLSVIKRASVLRRIATAAFLSVDDFQLRELFQSNFAKFDSKPGRLRSTERNVGSNFRVFVDPNRACVHTTRERVSAIGMPVLFVLLLVLMARVLALLDQELPRELVADPVRHRHGLRGRDDNYSKA